MLKYALWVLFCIASPLHSALGQQPGVIWDVHVTVDKGISSSAFQKLL